MTPFSVINTKIKTRPKVNFLERASAGASRLHGISSHPQKPGQICACAATTKQRSSTAFIPSNLWMVSGKTSRNNERMQRASYSFLCLFKMEGLIQIATGGKVIWS